MVRLKHIEAIDGVIRCLYAPEKSEQWGSMEVDVATGEVRNISFSSYPQGKNMYAGHVRSKLMYLWNHEKDALPSESLAIWY